MGVDMGYEIVGYHSDVGRLFCTECADHEEGWDTIATGQTHSLDPCDTCGRALDKRVYMSWRQFLDSHVTWFARRRGISYDASMRLMDKRSAHDDWVRLLDNHQKHARAMQEALPNLKRYRTSWYLFGLNDRD